MKSNLLLLLLFVLSSALSGCAKLLYRGDGKLITGSSYSSPYQIDLGRIELARPKTYHYTMENLPRTTFYVGVQITDEEANGMEAIRDSVRNDEKDKKRNYPVVVQVVLKDEKGNLVINETAELTHWTRSYVVGDKQSFFYRRGSSIDVLTARGGITPKQTGLKASRGWGTSFIPEAGKLYRLDISILSSAMDLPAKIIVQ